MPALEANSHAEVFNARQQRLVQALGADFELLIHAGWPRPRNYRGTTFRFRADSSFYYFIGHHLPGALFAILDGERILFVPDPPPGDELWHGASPSHEELRSACGVQRVCSLTHLEERLQDAGLKARLSVLPCTDALARVDQAARFERNWTGARDPQDLADKDARLANAVIELRLCHDDPAIQGLKRSAEITVQAHRAAMRAARPGCKEYEVLAALTHVLGCHDAMEAYSSICTVNGQVLHHFGYDQTTKAGDLLLLDAGAEHCGWASDVTRTFPVSGTFSATQRAIYDIVLASQRAGIEKVRAGVRYLDVHLTCARVLTQGLVDLGIFRGDVDALVDRGAHALFFPHGTGHLIGLDVHDMENFGDRAGYAPGRKRSEQFGLSFLRLDRDLAPGMAVTVEPGFYQVPALLNGSDLATALDADNALNRDALAKFADVKGIRLEDDILCTEGAPQVLTGDLEIEADAIESLMAH